LRTALARAPRAGAGDSGAVTLLRLRNENGLALDPELATGDGALGFWQALHEVWPYDRTGCHRARAA